MTQSHYIGTVTINISFQTFLYVFFLCVFFL